MEFIRFDLLPAASGTLGVITLDRCKALNALTFDMVASLRVQLTTWATQPEVIAVVIQSECPRAFCAGGDIRALYEGRNDYPGQLNFFEEEYQLNYLIGTYPKPIVALLQGIVMGGGAGLSIHASHRVACETLRFAMPETGIGLFPDIGASYFLNKMPGFLGRYLGLSGAHINLADAVYAGLVDYVISSNYYPEIIQALQQMQGSPDSYHEMITEILIDFAVQPDQSMYQQQQDFIDSIFCANQVATILDYLCHDDGEWSQAVLAHLQEKSPMSLTITLEALRRAAQQPLDFCLQQDFLLIQGFLKSADLYEGIRAVVIDKDLQPVWQPNALNLINDQVVSTYFDPAGKKMLPIQ